MKIHIIIAALLIVPHFSGISGNYENDQDPFPVDHEDKLQIHTLSFGGGWSHSGLRDLGISPLYYSGNHLQGYAGYQKATNTQINSLDVSFLMGRIIPAINPELSQSRMRNLKAEVNYSHRILIGSFINQNGKWYLGGRLNSQYGSYKHNLFANSAINQYFVSNIGVSSLISYPLAGDEKQYLMVFQMHLPLVAAILRKSYGYIKPEGFLYHNKTNLNSVFNSLEFCTVNNYFNPETELSVEYRLKNDNAFRFGYKWGYLGHQNQNPLKSAIHGIFLQSVFNL